MFRCCDCGRIYDSADELKKVEESRGEFWGIPCAETMYYCWCGSDDFEDVLELEVKE